MGIRIKAQVDYGSRHKDNAWTIRPATPRAARLRAGRIGGRLPTRREIRDRERARKKDEAGRWTINRLWQEDTAHRVLKGLAQDRSRFEHYLKPAWGNKEPHEIMPLEIDRLRLRILKDKAPKP